MLYYFLSNGKKGVQIPFASFASKMEIFLQDNSILVMGMVFRFYDTNDDGAIKLLDLLHAASFVPCDSQFGEEINFLIETYLGKATSLIFLEKVVMPRKRRVIYEISKHLFSKFLEKS